MKLNKKFIRGSFVLLVVFNIYALLNFIFQATMARFLSIADYGVLAALFYLVYLLSTFAESIQTVFAKHAATERDNGKTKNILKRAMKKLSRAAVIFFIAYLILAIPLFLVKEIPYMLLTLNGLFIFTLLFLPVTRGIMQGKKKFFSLGANLIVEASVKLALAAFFVFAGWRVYGAVAGAFLGTFVALLFSFFSVKDIITSKEKSTDTLELKTASKSVFFANFALYAFYIADILIAQIVFDKELAGMYSVASVLSKAIFWGTQPIGKAMFPISIEENHKIKKERDNTYYNALLLLGLGVAIALILFYFFPGNIIKIFSGKELYESIKILFYLGLATSALAFANLNILYRLSGKKVVKRVYIYYVFFVIGIVLLFVFNQSLLNFSLAFLTASIMFLWGSIVIN